MTDHEDNLTIHTPLPESVRRFGDGAVSGAMINIVAKIIGQVVSFGSIAILARILTPNDFGLIAMVLCVTAFFQVFSDMGLSLVTVQRREISQEQLSILFWINAGFGAVLGLLTAALAPAMQWFFHDERLFNVTLVLSLVFPLAALGVQHQALMKRHMRFRRLAVVRFSGLAFGAVIAVVAALNGQGYWSLVYQALGLAAASSVASWFLIRWRPGRPRRCADMRSMLTFGGTLTAHGLIGYLSRNLDKVLLGRFCGAHALGLYSTAYNLMMRPIRLAGHSIGDASIPAMSRIADNPDGMRKSYRRMFSLTCLIGFPVCLGSLIWADDIVLTLLGVKWTGAIVIMQILFVAAIPRMLTASTGWVYVASGRPDRMLRWQIVWAPIVALSFVAGLPFEAIGVATAYAIVMWLGMFPWFAYCFRGTEFRASDVLQPLWGPLICALGSCAAGSLVQMLILGDAAAGPLRLVVRLAAATAVFGASTAMFVPLANEGYRKMSQRIRSWGGRSQKLAGAVTVPSVADPNLSSREHRIADNIE